jgi:N4-gp56 family major capsid protein
MATTAYPVNHPLAVKRWSNELMKEALKRTYALQFMGTDANSLAQVKTEVSKAAGDKITFGIRAQLSGGGIQGDAILEGNEEALATYSQSVLIDQLRHAVRSDGKMSEQRVPFSVRDEARDGLADWWADRFDYWFFNQLTGNTTEADARYYGFNALAAPDADHLIAIGTGSSTNLEASLSATTTCKMNLTGIDYAVEKAKLAKNALRPVRVGGDDYFVMFLHPWQVTDLRTNTNTAQWADIQKAAMQGGNVADNPIFTGALGIYNGVILKEAVRLPNISTSQVTASSSSGVIRAVLCGAQAICLAFGRGYGQNTYSWVEELFDYDNQLGVAAGCIGGMVKTRFNGSDFATVVVSTYAAAH